MLKLQNSKLPSALVKHFEDLKLKWVIPSHVKASKLKIFFGHGEDILKKVEVEFVRSRPFKASSFLQPSRNTWFCAINVNEGHEKNIL